MYLPSLPLLCRFLTLFESSEPVLRRMSAGSLPPLSIGLFCWSFLVPKRENRNVNKRSLLVALAFMALVAQAAERPEVTEEKVQAALPELEKLAEQAMQKTGIPGMAIAVVSKDQ